MKRPNPYLLSLAAAFATSFTLLGPTTAEAAPGGYYKAKPVAAAVDSRLIVRDAPWRCDANGCVSSVKAASRAAHMCESLVKKIGAVTSFRAGDAEFAADELAKCNARAKGARTMAAK